ncbi:MAG: IPTL-CTERM sorting domain-containing protein, partial [Thermodesulfobacteriota bacterium]
VPGEFARAPSVDGNGSLLAFESDANYNGNNPNTVREIWVYEVANKEFLQVTDVSDGLSEDARISADGSSVAFGSRSDIGNNPDLRREVYVAQCFRGELVPTLSEWGLIAMAGVLGLIGFAVLRRRQAAA